jgi:hypothetical protein
MQTEVQKNDKNFMEIPKFCENLKYGLFWYRKTVYLLVIYKIQTGFSWFLYRKSTSGYATHFFFFLKYQQNNFLLACTYALVTHIYLNNIFKIVIVVPSLCFYKVLSSIPHVHSKKNFTLVSSPMFRNHPNIISM